MFDRKVHIRDTKTGKLLHVNAYTEHIRQNEGTYLERPKGSGNLWYEDGKPAGRFHRSKKYSEQVELGVDHVAFVSTAQTENEKLREALAASEAKNIALEAKQIAAEQAKKIEVKPAVEPMVQKAAAKNKGRHNG
jgi:hypothetical protein